MASICSQINYYRFDIIHPKVDIVVVLLLNNNKLALFLNASKFQWIKRISLQRYQTLAILRLELFCQ
ncbi:MAG: hypothetical protein K0R98_1411 [Rickettsiaceae bacterium]|jgi:hypothetical protein|nr:hypothetical protein [Rickettsiaceae bacterium]